jgi:hypothetical protein
VGVAATRRPSILWPTSGPHEPGCRRLGTGAFPGAGHPFVASWPQVGRSDQRAATSITRRTNGRVRSGRLTELAFAARCWWPGWGISNESRGHLSVGLAHRGPRMRSGQLQRRTLHGAPRDDDPDGPRRVVGEPERSWKVRSVSARMHAPGVAATRSGSRLTRSASPGARAASRHP